MWTSPAWMCPLHTLSPRPPVRLTVTLLDAAHTGHSMSPHSNRRHSLRPLLAAVLLYIFRIHTSPFRCIHTSSFRHPVYTALGAVRNSVGPRQPRDLRLRLPAPI